MHGFGARRGDKPAHEQKMIALIRMVETNFRAAGYDDSSFRLLIDPMAKHDERAWAKRFPDAVKFNVRRLERAAIDEIAFGRDAT